MNAPIFQEPTVSYGPDLFAGAEKDFSTQAMPGHTPRRAEPPARGPQYQPLDLLARRTALAIQREDLPPVLDLGEQAYAAQEDGVDPVKRYFVRQFDDMEAFVAKLADDVVTDASADPVGGVVILDAVADQEGFTAAYPQAQRDGRVYPCTLEYVALGRAAAELTRRGYTVEIYRGDRRADLAVRRHAIGMRAQRHAAALLGLSRDKYTRLERNHRTPSSGGLVAELQGVDDFITETAARLTVDAAGAGIGRIRILNGKHAFERAYPQARTLRGNPYPVEVLRVAAARRAGELAAGGQHTLIAPADA